MPPSASALFPVLEFLPSLPVEKGRRHPQERDIQRYSLTDIAPDREDAIVGMPIEVFRESVKLRAADSGHWLFQSRERLHTKLRDATVRIAAIRRSNSTQQLRRSRSASSLRAIAPRMLNIADPRFLDAARTWGRNVEQVVSPRPLGPTHLLVVFDIDPLSGIFSRVLECPINDIAFVANCPNLRPDPTRKALPHRMQRELPRVLIRVPVLDTFPALLVYLHTKNQAALFRALVPEWIRDVVHPLPAQVSVAPSAGPVLGHRGRKMSIRLTQGGHIPELPMMQPRRTVESIAREIVEAEVTIPQAAAQGELLEASLKLNGLKDNLDFIGYYGAELCYELDMMQDIMVRALNLKAKVDE